MRFHASSPRTTSRSVIFMSYNSCEVYPSPHSTISAIVAPAAPGMLERNRFLRYGKSGSHNNKPHAGNESACSRSAFHIKLLSMEILPKFGPGMSFSSQQLSPGLNYGAAVSPCPKYLPALWAGFKVRLCFINEWRNTRAHRFPRSLNQRFVAREQR